MAYPNVLLIHGFLETEAMWKFLLPALPGGVSHTCVSLPASEPGAPLMAGIAEAASEICSRLEGKWLVIGHSMGGYVAAEIAHQQPHRVEGLCMLHSTATADSPERQRDRLRAIEALYAGKHRYVRTMINSLFHDPALALAAREEMIDHAVSLDEAQVASCIQAMMRRHDHVATLAARAFPLYYFLGTADSRLPVTMMQEELSRLPGAVAHFADGCGHMGHLECPGEVIAFVRRVLMAHR